MSWLNRDRAPRLLALLAAVVPFAFATIRLRQTGSDARALWMAVAACVGACAVIAMSTRSKTKPFALVLLTFLVSSALAAATGFLLGARAGPAVWAVGCGFGVFNALCVWLLVRRS